MNICPKCGKNLEEGKTLCEECSKQTLSQNEPLKSADNASSDLDEALVDAYIGKNADKIKDGKFSFCCFFLGTIYTLYRKMYSLTIIMIIFQNILLYISFPIVDSILVNKFGFSAAFPNNLLDNPDIFTIFLLPFIFISAFHYKLRYFIMRILYHSSIF